MVTYSLQNQCLIIWLTTATTFAAFNVIFAEIGIHTCPVDEGKVWLPSRPFITSDVLLNYAVKLASFWHFTEFQWKVEFVRVTPYTAGGLCDTVSEWFRLKSNKLLKPFWNQDSWVVRSWVVWRVVRIHSQTKAFTWIKEVNISL